MILIREGALLGFLGTDNGLYRLTICPAKNPGKTLGSFEVGKRAIETRRGLSKGWYAKERGRRAPEAITCERRTQKEVCNAVFFRFVHERLGFVNGAPEPCAECRQTEIGGFIRCDRCRELMPD